MTLRGLSGHHACREESLLGLQSAGHRDQKGKGER